MRKAKILYKDEEAGVLMQHDDGSFTFKYNDNWIDNQSKPAISLTLQKNEKEFHSSYLFPFFYHMLPEGSNKQVACRLNKIDLKDDFGLLMTVAKHDSIGAVTVKKMDN